MPTDVILSSFLLFFARALQLELIFGKQISTPEVALRLGVSPVPAVSCPVQVGKQTGLGSVCSASALHCTRPSDHMDTDPTASTILHRILERARDRARARGSCDLAKSKKGIWEYI